MVVGEHKKEKDFSAKQARLLSGVVLSNKMDKTIVVEVTRTVQHPLYGKIVKKFKKYNAHDADNVCAIGDVVEIAECRPLSKTKHMMLNRIVSKNEQRSV